MDVPLISHKQLDLIVDLLPPSRRDPVLVTAILYRAFSGGSLRDVAELFPVTRCRLHEGERDLAAVLPRILRTLRLRPLPSAMYRRGGGQDWRRRTPGVHERVVAYQLQEFGEALTDADTRHRTRA